MVAAIPNVVGQNDFSDTPPGHRFGLYFDAWDANWKIPDAEKQAALRRVALLSGTARQLLSSLHRRQNALAAAVGNSIWRRSAKSTAPFLTGTGMEHPLENGFAFLNPYGLPYLPGSSVKGVLRRAVELLANGEFGDQCGWDAAAIATLFGYEAPSGEQNAPRNRGSLIFWDVLPEPASGKLAVDIMTPHYSHYYQGNSPPTDSGQPNPIMFLTVPPGSRFDFYVQCQTATLPEPLRNTWPSLLDSAFQHAFDWLGFGAKTAIGYGHLQAPPPAEVQATVQRQAEEQARQAAAQAMAALSVEQRALHELRGWLAEDQAAKRKEPGGRLANRLNELLRDGLSWPPTEREELAKLAEGIYGYLDWGSGKKKQERKAKIQKLRET